MYGRNPPTIDGIPDKPNMGQVYDVDIHNQQCPVCGAIASIQGGQCSSCGVRCRLVEKVQMEDGNMGLQKTNNVKAINPKYLKTAKDVLEGESEDPFEIGTPGAQVVAEVDPLEEFRDDGGEIVFKEEAPKMNGKQYAVLVLKQIKETIKENAKHVSPFFSKIEIELEPFKFEVSIRPKKVVL